MFNWFFEKNSNSITPQNLINLGLIIFTFFSPFSIAGAQTGLCLALLGWVWKIIYRKSLNWQSSFFELPVVLYLGALFLSIIFSQNRLTSLYSLKEEWLLIVPFILINNLNDEKTIRKLQKDNKNYFIKLKTIVFTLSSVKSVSQ